MTATPSGNSSWDWAASTTDPRALQKASVSTGDRIASCWYSSGSFTIDLNFADQNPQNGKAVSVSGISATGPDAGNYTANAEASTVADITGATLTVVGITAQNKVYDGTAVATLNLESAMVIGIVSGDDVTVVASGVAGAFSDAEVGTGKLVTVSGLLASS